MTAVPLLQMRLAVVALIAVRIAPLNPVEIKGYKFFDSETGKEFVVKGIDYFPRPNSGDLNHNSIDLFTDKHKHIWQRDIPFLQELGVNAVRLYAVNATEDHDAFMCALNAAGIYAVVALAQDCPTCAVTKDQAPDCYPKELKLQGQQVINAFAKYPNTLAFSAGNEVNHFAPPDNPEWNGPCQKKFLRDMREYIDSCKHTRTIPIGLVSADNDREALASYYNCQSDPSDKYENAEWYGLNSYVVCDGQAQTFGEAPGFQLLVQSFKSLGFSIPVLLTEFGCLDMSFPEVDGYPSQRTFQEAKWMIGVKDVRDQFSGGFAFEYSIEMENAKSDSPYPFKTFGKQNYGIGWLAPEDCDDINKTCSYTPFPSYYNLQTAYETENQTSILDAATFSAPEDRQGRSKCPHSFPSLDSFTWEADSQTSIKCVRSERFVCPASFHKIMSGGHEKALGVASFLLIVAIAGVFVATVLGYLVCLPRRRNADGSKIPHTLTFAESDSQSGDSDESTGLLSLRKYDQSKGPDYEAIEDQDPDPIDKL